MILKTKGKIIIMSPTTTQKKHINKKVKVWVKPNTAKNTVAVLTGVSCYLASVLIVLKQDNLCSTLVLKKSTTHKII